MKLESERQVLDFIASLAPDPRRSVRFALRALTAGRGDVKALKAEAARYFRLRVKAYRIIFRYARGQEAASGGCTAFLPNIAVWFTIGSPKVCVRRVNRPRLDSAIELVALQIKGQKGQFC